MHFLADECLYKTTVELLRNEGHKVTTVEDLNLRGSADSKIINEALFSDLAFITADHDFGNILQYPPEKYCGIIVLKISKTNENIIHRLLVDFLKEIETIKNILVVIDGNKIRIRKGLK